MIYLQLSQDNRILRYDIYGSILTIQYYDLLTNDKIKKVIEIQNQVIKINLKQQDALIIIQLQKSIPKCFGKEWNNQSKICIKCFCFNECSNFIRDFGYIKNGIVGHPNILKRECKKYKMNGREYDVR